MIINPQTLVDHGYVKGIKDLEKQLQPNALDFTLDQLFTYSSNTFAISEEAKQMRGNVEVTPLTDRRNNLQYFALAANTSYDALSGMYVNLPEGIAASLVIRSTFNRNGIFLTAGLYDSGFAGHIGFALHNQAGPAHVTVGTRVGQIIFYQSDNASLYSGQWNHSHGTLAGQQLQ